MILLSQYGFMFGIGSRANTARVRRRDFEIVGIKNHAAVAPSAPRRVSAIDRILCW